MESTFLMHMNEYFTPLLTGKVQKPFQFSEVTHTYLDMVTLKQKDKLQLLVCSIRAQQSVPPPTRCMWGGGTSIPSGKLL